MKYHLANTHNIDKETFVCGIEKCVYKTHSSLNLKSHQKNKHLINVVWYHCDGGDGCAYKTKYKSSLNNHKNKRHNNLVPNNCNTPYFFCGEGGCEYKSKQKSNVMTHKAKIHKSKLEVRNEISI